ncbi:hypothetical protein NX783_13595 [Massilia kyonggiensis]|nr:hypothetical protein [Massilia kyonggiensis]
MWIAASPLQKRLVAALEDDTEIKATDFPEAELIAEGEILAASPLLGEFVELLLEQWRDLDDQVAATRLICFGLKKNTFRDAFIHAIDALTESGFDDLSSFAKALDSRASDDESSLHIRLEAVNGLTQFALQLPRLTPYAVTGVLRLLDVDDDWAKAKLCRIASILHDQLAWPDAIDSLKTLTRCEACATEARQELGFVEMANAFRSGDLTSMTSCFARSATWFDESASLAEDAPRARMYATIASALANTLTSDTTRFPDIRSLNENAQWVACYCAPRVGAAWLAPPPEAELEWIPLLAPIGSSPVLDPISLLASALQLFEKVRSVRVFVNGQWEYRAPSGISKLAEQGRFVGTMRTWLRGSATTVMTAEGRARLESNIALTGVSPGKH